MSKKPIDIYIRKRGLAFSRILKEERKAQNHTQEQLAKMANVSLDTVRSIEHGRIANPGLFIAASLVEVLKGDLTEWVKRTK